MFEWKCPDCGARVNQHGKGECTSRTETGCGFFCECGDDGEDGEHGVTLQKICHEARCYHCGWEGSYPQMPKKLQAWEKAALKAGWTPPEPRLSELGMAKTKVAVAQPAGGCDGLGKYAYDPEKEDGKGKRLSKRCPGCRACK